MVTVGGWGEGEGERKIAGDAPGEDVKVRGVRIKQIDAKSKERVNELVYKKVYEIGS